MAVVSKRKKALVGKVDIPGERLVQVIERVLKEEECRTLT